MTTLKEFEDALREQGMHMALAILQKLRERDRTTRTIAPARRIAGRKMTPELARQILDLHATTEMTQQEIAFQLERQSGAGQRGHQAREVAGRQSCSAGGGRAG